MFHLGPYTDIEQSLGSKVVWVLKILFELVAPRRKPPADMTHTGMTCLRLPNIAQTPPTAGLPPTSGPHYVMTQHKQSGRPSSHKMYAFWARQGNPSRRSLRIFHNDPYRIYSRTHSTHKVGRAFDLPHFGVVSMSGYLDSGLSALSRPVLLNEGGVWSELSL